MALPLPRLDNRTFDQLVSEGQVLLPRYAPAWTNYNAADPGITILELLAWLAETDFYRLDRTPAASSRAFLRLVGVEPRAAQVAEAVVMATLPAGFAAFALPAGVGTTSADGVTAFETAQETSIWGATLAAALTGAASDPADRSAQNLAGNALFPAFGSTPQVGHALYLGFDIPLGHTVWPLSMSISSGSEAEDRRNRELLQAEWESAQAEAAKESTGVLSAPFDWRRHYAAQVVWEYYTGAGRWEPLTNVDDETRALSLTGLVRFTLPAAPAHAAGGVDGAGQATRFFIRGRLAGGHYDCPPYIRSIAFNALRVRHAVNSGAKRLVGLSNGGAGQRFSLGSAPIVPGTTDLTVMVSGVADAAWQEAPNWDRAGPHDRAYVVSQERGEIEFGDGRRGRVPSTGAELWASYQVGGGHSGNVPANTLTRLQGSAYAGVTLTQPFDALGGEDEEELDHAIGRALDAQSAPSRAVTLEDFESLSLSTPGVPIARAHAIADYNPAMPCLPAPGSTTVVVVPHCPTARPEPTPELLCLVARYLERRRTVTAELHVVGPWYTTVAVQARLHPLPGTDVRGLLSAARAALDRFLDPLRGGPDGTGWPVGREVYRAELLALLNDLPGVSHVDGLTLRQDDREGSRCGNVTVCRHGLVVPGIHQITIETGSHCYV
jgi:predicted phage baseplate assembly protein